MSKKVPVVKITTPEAAIALEGLPVQAFATSAGLVVMQQMLTEELTAIVGPKHAKLGAERVGPVAVGGPLRRRAGR